MVLKSIAEQVGVVMREVRSGDLSAQRLRALPQPRAGATAGFEP